MWSVMVLALAGPTPMRQPRRRSAQFVARLGLQAGAPRDHITRFDERGVVVRVGAAAHGFVAQAHELVDIELVVREQHEVLEVLRRCAGVMAQPVQRIVDPRGGEQGQRLGRARGRLEGAVGDAVVHGVEVGQIEAVAHQQAPFGAQIAFDVVVLRKRKVHWDRLRAGADFQRDVVVLQQQAELFEVVVREQVGPRQRGLVAARARDKAVAQARIGTRHRVGVDSHEGVAGTHAARERLAGHEAVERAAQVRNAAVVDGAHLGECGGRVVEARGRNVGGSKRHGVPLGSGLILAPDR
jgi:hypothetical protein